MSTQEFFSEQSEQSKIKSAIVAKYFDAWARVIMGAQDKKPGADIRLAYIDLFAGPGRYDDGTPSTPVQILEKAIANDKLRDRLVTVFNDSDRGFVKTLREVIERVPGIETLKVPPEVHTFEVGQQLVGSTYQPQDDSVSGLFWIRGVTRGCRWILSTVRPKTGDATQFCSSTTTG